MEKYYINKSNKKLYTIQELSKKLIQENTLIKKEGGREWTKAKFIEELTELVQLNNPYPLIKKSERSNIVIINLFVLVPFYVIGVMLVAVLLKYLDVNDVNIEDFSFLSAVVFVIALGIYQFFITRFYRIVKVTEERKNNIEVYYSLQTYMSLKKEISDLNQDKIKWRNIEKKLYIGEAKSRLKEKTHGKNIRCNAITATKKSINKATLLEILWENNRFLRYAFKNPFTLIPLGAFLMIFTIFFFEFLDSYDKESQKEIIFFLKKGFQIVALLLFIYNIIIYLKSRVRYLRIIKKVVTDGGYRDTKYHIQSYTTITKDISKIRGNKKIKWTNTYVTTRKSYGREEVIKLFDKKTEGVIIKMEKI